jgi:hypothetical protein
MCMALFIDLSRSHFSSSCSDFKRWCWGDRSHTSLVSIVHRAAACPVTSLCLPLEVSSVASVGDLAMVPPRLTTTAGGTAGFPSVGRAYVEGARGIGT